MCPNNPIGGWGRQNCNEVIKIVLTTIMHSKLQDVMVDMDFWSMLLQILTCSCVATNEVLK